MTKKERADQVLQYFNDYLEENGWVLDNYTLMRKDPKTGDLHHNMTAINIQLDRDLVINQSKLKVVLSL